MKLILIILVIFMLLVISEMWWRIRKPHDELSRKFIHIFVGSLVAFTPFFLSWTQIFILSAGFIVAVAFSKYFGIFKSIHAVERPTWGEIFFALSVGLLAFVTHQPWVYAAALLHMSMADGLAAIVGVSWGRRNDYKILGHTKSMAGSAAFLVVSLAILFVYSSTLLNPLSLGLIVSLAVLATSIENLGIGGLDNLFVPLVVGFVLARA